MIEDDDPVGDWTRAGVYRSAPGVFRIPLPLPSDGLRAVNVYAMADGAGWTLVDSGWALAVARELLVAALAELGAGLADVRRFLVTHAHRDHYTQGVALRREFGARIAPRARRAAVPGGDPDRGGPRAAGAPAAAAPGRCA